MKNVLILFIVLTVLGCPLFAQNSDTTQAPYTKKYHNVVFNLGMGGGPKGFGLQFNFYYGWLGFGYSQTLTEVPNTDLNCSECFFSGLDYDREYEKRYTRGVDFFELLLKIPVTRNLFLMGSGGYFYQGWADVRVYEDDIFETEYSQFDKGITESGYSWGCGLLYQFGKTRPSGNVILGLEYKNPIGGFINIGCGF